MENHMSGLGPRKRKNLNQDEDSPKKWQLNSDVDKKYDEFNATNVSYLQELANVSSYTENPEQILTQSILNEPTTELLELPLERNQAREQCFTVINFPNTVHNSAALGGSQMGSMSKSMNVEGKMENMSITAPMNNNFDYLQNSDKQFTSKFDNNENFNRIEMNTNQFPKKLQDSQISDAHSLSSNILPGLDKADPDGKKRPYFNTHLSTVNYSGSLSNVNTSIDQTSNSHQTPNHPKTSLEKSPDREDSVALKKQRFLKTQEVLQHSGLLDITMKTANLINKQSSLDTEIQKLQKDLNALIGSILNNPENLHLKDVLI